MSKANDLEKNNLSKHKSILIPNAPAVVMCPTHAIWIESDGEVEQIQFSVLNTRLISGQSPFVCHAPSVARKLQIKPFSSYDLLELFAFIHPAKFCLPTPGGLATALNLEIPLNSEGEALLLFDAAAVLLSSLSKNYVAVCQPRTLSIAKTMAASGWIWGSSILRSISNNDKTSISKRHEFSDNEAIRNNRKSFAVWDNIEDWPEYTSKRTIHNVGVSSSEARGRLTELLGSDAELRPQQSDYTSSLCAGFQPDKGDGIPSLVLAEAGTGVGKTLGYIAPASLWAEKNESTVFCSTYTRNLQQQIDTELDKLFPEKNLKNEKVVIRKGRENYLCLLNLEEAINHSNRSTRDIIALGLIVRWAEISRDGDMIGGDFPGWLREIIGNSMALSLTDRRGECTFSSCSHYRKCFIEKTHRKARFAEIVIANHALVMQQGTRGLFADNVKSSPMRLIFDEGHHIFDAADSAFSSHLTGDDASDLRRWLLGVESRNRNRGRGLAKRIEDLIFDNDIAKKALTQVMQVARELPEGDWSKRVSSGVANGDFEKFLLQVRVQVLEKCIDKHSLYTLEVPTEPHMPGLREASQNLELVLSRLLNPLLLIEQGLRDLLIKSPETIDSHKRQRIEGLIKGLSLRTNEQLRAWHSMVAGLISSSQEEKTQNSKSESIEYIDWFAIKKIAGKEANIGMFRHFLDPTIPFANAILSGMHGVVVTSATLCDHSSNIEDDWLDVEARTGFSQVVDASPIRANVPSPFDYGRQTQIYVINDVGYKDLEKRALAYRELFAAAGGGGLGLFTAISRLRDIHSRILMPMESRGLRIWAQHVDELDTGSLVDIFRQDVNSCLLGTDAVRDGVDVPGRSLRIIVFDRVPWPRPDILHKARKKVFGGRAYDDMLTRRRLKQAYGRLIRSENDKGIFVLLDSALPSRLITAFPSGVVVNRVGLSEAIQATKSFLAN